MMMNDVHAADHANDIAADGPDVDAVAREREAWKWADEGNEKLGKKKKKKKSGCSKNEIEKRESTLIKMK